MLRPPNRRFGEKTMFFVLNICFPTKNIFLQRKMSGEGWQLCAELLTTQILTKRILKMF